MLFSFFLYLILIVVLIILINNNTDLKKKLEKNNNKINFCPNCGYDLNNVNNDHIFSETNYSYHENELIKVREKLKKEKISEKELKNNIILIVGSMLIILSSIIFLTSTWNLTHSFIKILIIVLIFGVFLLSSYVANKYLSLNKTSDIFYNIAMIYIPIGLFSISTFSLLGDYLSINGEGRNIYYIFVSIFVSIFYYLISKKNSSNLFSYLGFIFHILCVIFFVNLFTSNIILIFSGIIVYSILFIMLYNNHIIYNSKEIHNTLYKLLGYSVSGISGYFCLVSLFDISVIENVMFYLFIFIHSYYFYSYTLKKNIIFDIIYPLVLILTGISIAGLIDEFKYVQVFIIISNILIYLINLFRERRINIISNIYVILCTFILWLFTINYIGFEKLLFNSVVILLSYFVLNIISYLNNKDLFNSYSLIISSYLLVGNVLIYYELPLIIILYYSLFMLLINILNKINTLNISIKYVSLFSSFMFILYCLFNELDNLYFMIFMVIYYIVMFIYYYLYKDEKYKIISYISINIAILSISNVFDLMMDNYIILISNIIILMLEKFFNIKSNGIKKLLFIQFIINYVLLVFEVCFDNFILLIFLNSLFIYYLYYYKRSDKFHYLIFGSLIPFLYFGYDILDINLLYLISIFVITVIISLIRFKNDIMYYILFYVFIVLNLFNLSNILYIDLGIALLGTYIIYKVNRKYNNDIFKTIMYFIGLLLYKNIISDLGIYDITIIDYGIYVLLIILLSRTIFIKYNFNRLFEYLSLSLLYLITIFNYSSEVDGMMFVFLMLFVVIISYILKYGPIFLVSLIAILLNIFILTRVFWFNIPWWIYILVIGVILVLFAIRNETKEKNSNKGKVDEFKNKLNL